MYCTKSGDKMAKKKVEEVVETKTKKTTASSKKKKEEVVEETTPKKKGKKVVEEPTPVSKKKTKKVEVIEEEEVIEEAPAPKKKKKREVLDLPPITVGDKMIVDPAVGLTSKQVEDRMIRGYFNETNKGSTKTIPNIIFKNVFTFFNMILIALAIWLLSAGGKINQLMFLVVAVANTSIGIYQEIKAKKTIDSLSLLSAPTTSVIRDGQEVEIPVNEIVIDDIMVLRAGKQICADGIVKGGMIEVNESLLTGESDIITKRDGADVMSGSFVVAGECTARVIAVGKDNYIERLSQQAKKYNKPKSELMKYLNIIVKVMGILIVPLGFLSFMTYYNDHGYNYAVTHVVASSNSMIPAGLMLITSISLFKGVTNLAKNKTLVQELYCIEMLARINVLCLDKTGTITDGSMNVKELVQYPAGEKYNLRHVLSTMNYALKETNQTGQALEKAFGKQKKFSVEETIPFSSARKYSAVVLKDLGKFYSGAPEFVLKDKYKLISKDVEKYAGQGYRVLVIGHGEDGNVEPLGLILVEDTIRKDAIETINYFRNSGVEVKVISGDNPLTVSKVAIRAGVKHAEKYISLDGLSDEEVENVATEYTVFGRVTPNQKKILVQSLKKQRMTVAMTGDGVNDILALKEADCSIAMASGSEAARNVSQLVLLDSNFSSMPKVVREGRRVINNIERVASLFLVKTIFAFILTLLGIVVPKMGFPFSSPAQLYLFEWFIIAIPSLVLAIEPNNNVIKGKFIVNVLKSALPAALVVVIDTMIVYALKSTLGIDADGAIASTQVGTIMAMVTAFTGLIILFDICKPFNLVKGLTFVTMILLILICVATPLISEGFLDFAPKLKAEHWLLTIMLMETSVFLYKIFTMAYGKIKEWIVNYLVKVYKIVDTEEYYY